MYQPNDKYAQKAKAAGYRSRAVYKLEEINQKFLLLKPGQFVLDLGAAPGSWLQYCAQIVGNKGKIIGVDISPIAILPPANIKIIKQDIFALDKLMTELVIKFDVVLSDAAPATSGISLTDSSRSLAMAEQSLKIALLVLKPKGNFCTKIFMSPEADEFYHQLKKYFSTCHRFKPHTSRTNSKEIYFIGLKKKN
jgi:23S rRNA (uridine2552-2'-O)-methyltransferase